MINNAIEATYLVDGRYLLQLLEIEGGFQYHCFSRGVGGYVGHGVINWSDIENLGVHSPLTSARELAIQALASQAFGMDGKNIALVAQGMLAEFPRGRKLLREMGKREGDLKRSIRFIDSRYNEKFRIPDGGVIKVKYPDREIYQKCFYIDDHHMQAGYSIYHICEFAEMLERNCATCEPEPVIMSEQTAWRVRCKGYLMIQTCENGYDYTFYDETYHEIDGGWLDNPEISMSEARDEILTDIGWDKRAMERVNYERLLSDVEQC